MNLKIERAKIVGVTDLDQLSLLDRARKCQEWINQLNIKVSQHNRISSICNAITRGDNNIIEYHEERFALVRQAHKDLIELSLIIEVFGEELEEKYPQKLRQLFKDSPIPFQTAGNTIGYDTQFELFVGAICKRAGMHLKIGKDGDPDWFTSTPAFNLSVEAKRSKSMDSLESLIRKAGNQIQKSKKGGVIMLDATHAFNPDDVQINVPADDKMIQRAHEKNINSAMDSCLKNIGSWLQSKSVGSIYVNQTIFRPGAKDLSLQLKWAAYSLWATINISGHLTPKPYQEFDSIFWAAMPRL